MNEKMIATEREQLKKFESIDMRLKDAKEALESVNQIIDGKSTYSSNTIQIGYTTFYGENRKKLAEALKPVFEKMKEESQSDMDKYFSEKESKEDEE